MWQALLTRAFAPLVAEVVVRLVDRYLRDAMFKAKIDEAVRLAQGANEHTVKDAARRLHEAINS